MRILFIGDIHSNLEALETCLAAAPQHDEIVNLGDIVGYGGSPNEVTARVRKLGGILVRGNHDKACTGIIGVENFNPIAGLAAIWTMRMLSPENLEWLKALPPGPAPLFTERPQGEGARRKTTSGTEMMNEPWGPDTVQLVHGSPLDEDDYIIVMRDAMEPLMHTRFNLTFFAHTHIQGGFSVKEDRWETLRPAYRLRDKVETFDLPLRRAAKYLINPGSVGQPRDGDRRAGFLLFDSDDYKVTYYRVPYDVEAAQRHILEARLPERLALRLAEGR